VVVHLQTAERGVEEAGEVGVFYQLPVGRVLDAVLEEGVDVLELFAGFRVEFVV
jgi:hypothetical protein